MKIDHVITIIILLTKIPRIFEHIFLELKIAKLGHNSFLHISPTLK